MTEYVLLIGWLALAGQTWRYT